MVPVRGLAVVLAPMVYATVPFPFPLAPLVTVIQPAPLVPVHAQPLVVETVVVYEPPVAGTLSDGEEMAKLQDVPLVKLKLFEKALRAVPPEPTAATSAV